MAHHKQSAKRIRTNLKARIANKAQRTAMKSAVRRVVRAENAEAGRLVLPEAMKRLDKAAKKGIIHKNAAARIKSRLARRLAKVQ